MDAEIETVAGYCGLPQSLDFDGFVENGGFEEIEDDDDSILSDSMSVFDGELIKRTISGAKTGRRRKIPRLLVKDIRKIYSTMFVNVINSGDFALLYGFLDTYYDRNLAQYTITKYAPGGTEKLFSMNFYGLNEVGKYWYSILSVSPDNVVIPLDCVIQPTTGKIICRFQKRATHLYVDPPGSAGYYAPYVFVDKKYGKEIVCTNDKKENDFVVGNVTDSSAASSPRSSASGSGSSSKEMTAKFNAIQEIMSSVDSVVKGLPLQSPPKNVVADGIFIISTDAHKRITKIEVRVGF